jgi:hypothetical protein
MKNDINISNSNLSSHKNSMKTRNCFPPLPLSAGNLNTLCNMPNKKQQVQVSDTTIDAKKTTVGKQKKSFHLNNSDGSGTMMVERALHLLSTSLCHSLVH